jgi:hypothetical protein
MARSGPLTPAKGRGFRRRHGLWAPAEASRALFTVNQIGSAAGGLASRQFNIRGTDMAELEKPPPPNREAKRSPAVDIDRDRGGKPELSIDILRDRARRAGCRPRRSRPRCAR